MRFGEYVAIVYTLINTLLIILLYRHGIKCAITKVKYIVELKDRVLAPWGLSSIFAVAELVTFVVSSGCGGEGLDIWLSYCVSPNLCKGCGWIVTIKMNY